MKFKWRSKTVTIAPFPATCTIIVTNDLVKTARKLDVFCGPRWMAFTVVQRSIGDTTLVITPKTSAGIIAHEAVHVLTQVYDYYRIKINVDNDEVMAYQMTELVDAIVGFQRGNKTKL